MVDEANLVVSAEQKEADALKRRADYNRAVRTAELNSILLRDLKFKVDRKAAPVRGQPVKMTGECNGAMIGLRVDEESGAMTASIEWGVELKVAKKRVASCKAVYDVVYNGFAEVDDDVVGLFAENVARPACYAYFRSLYASMDWAAELRFPPLPVVRFNPKV